MNIRNFSVVDSRKSSSTCCGQTILPPGQWILQIDHSKVANNCNWPVALSATCKMSSSNCLDYNTTRARDYCVPSSPASFCHIGKKNLFLEGAAPLANARPLGIQEGEVFLFSHLSILSARTQTFDGDKCRTLASGCVFVWGRGEKVQYNRNIHCLQRQQQIGSVCL